jgi:hypothetical protein
VGTLASLSAAIESDGPKRETVAAESAEDNGAAGPPQRRVFPSSTSSSRTPAARTCGSTTSAIASGTRPSIELVASHGAWITTRQLRDEDLNIALETVGRCALPLRVAPCDMTAQHAEWRGLRVEQHRHMARFHPLGAEPHQRWRAPLCRMASCSTDRSSSLNSGGTYIHISLLPIDGVPDGGEPRLVSDRRRQELHGAGRSARAGRRDGAGEFDLTRRAATTLLPNHPEPRRSTPYGLSPKCRDLRALHRRGPRWKYSPDHS